MLAQNINRPHSIYMSQKLPETNPDHIEQSKPSLAPVIGLGAAAVGAIVEFAGYIEQSPALEYGGWIVLAAGLVLHIKDDVKAHWKQQSQSK